LTQKELRMAAKDPNVDPSFAAKDPCFPQKSPIIAQKRSMLPQRSPIPQQASSSHTHTHKFTQT